MTDQTRTIPGLLAIYAALLCLLALTAGSSVLPGGWWSAPISLGIAFAKTFLIAAIFMNLKGQSGTVRVFSMAGLLWLLILISLSLADYSTRTANR
jgi:cytochrome c oxidase subunit IV